jgi:hypothetical protein
MTPTDDSQQRNVPTVDAQRDGSAQLTRCVNNAIKYDSEQQKAEI